MKIIFLNDKKLANNLKNGEVANSEKLFYCMFFLIGSQLLGLILFKIPIILEYNQENCFSCCKDNSISMLIIIPVISLLLKGYGIFVSYKINSIHYGKDFVERLICLLFPITIRMSILLFTIKFLTSLTIDQGNNIEILYLGNPILFIDKISGLIIAFYFYLRLIKNFKIISSI